MKAQTQSPRQLRQAPEAESPTMTAMAPPAFSLTASPEDGGGGKKKKPPVPSEPKRFEGPLAAAGEGDAHAFAEDDVYQGEVGDCWLMATLAAFAKANPSYLEEIIEEREDGKFNVKLYVREGGDEKSPLVRKTITVGRKFPTRADTGFPRYAGLGDDQMEIWVMVLEAAAVLISGGHFQDLDGEDPTVAFEMFTGQSSKNAAIYNERTDRWGSDEQAFAKAGLAAGKDTVLQLIADQVSEGNAVVLCTKDWGGKKKQFGNFTILGPHAYSVIDVDPAGGTISLRDPYGPDNLYDLPVDLLVKHFVSVDYGPAKSSEE
ncbi:MAG: C2 family cysteine protease [Bacteroidia bacterium]